MPKDSIKPLLIASLDASTLQAVTYTAINAVANGLDGPCFMIRITNASSSGVLVSYDGINDHDILLDGHILQLDFQTNSRPGNKVAQLAKGTKVYVRGAAGQGNIYLSGWYQE